MLPVYTGGTCFLHHAIDFCGYQVGSDPMAQRASGYKLVRTTVALWPRPQLNRQEHLLMRDESVADAPVREAEGHRRWVAGRLEDMPPAQRYHWPAAQTLAARKIVAREQAVHTVAGRPS